VEGGEKGGVGAAIKRGRSTRGGGGGVGEKRTRKGKA